MRPWSARWVSALAVFLAGVPALPVMSRHALVPWKVIERGAETRPAALNVYWIPASRDELRRSELLESNDLTLFSARCVAMQVVRPDDVQRIETLAAADLPVAILTDQTGREVARVAHERGALRVRAVEEMVRRALADRDAAADALLDEARRKAAGGDATAASAVYEKVIEQRCTCPRQGKAAERALRKLARR